MGQFTRQELEDAFAQYVRDGDIAGQTGDWSPWADHFAPDAVYWEHSFGRFHGREAIRAWITKTMAAYPGKRMNQFPVEWHVVDEDHGRVVMYVQNRMQDPGDGSVHESPNVTILVYAGDGLWASQEDLYNPNNFIPMLQGWEQRVKELNGD